MKETLKNIKEFFKTIFDSIKYDTFSEMCMMWAVFVGVFICIPILAGMFLYAIICSIPFMLICILLIILSFIIPFSIRTILEIIKNIRSAKEDDLYEE